MELSIDTASETASVALSSEGALVTEITWSCRRNHTVELLPTVDRLFAQGGASMPDLSAIFVCTGPGMYTGLRVGVSAAKGLAVSLGLRLLGIGRLELDAYPHSAFPGGIVAVHRAGRRELAWAAYEGSPWREVSAPRLSQPDELAGALTGPSLIVGEVDESLLDCLRAAADTEVSAPPSSANIRRAAGLAELGQQRLRAGEASDPALLVPVYLRPPAIGPQPTAP